VKPPRNTKLSLMEDIAAIFQDATTFGTAFNIYYEDDLRGAVVPTFPYLYILDHNVTFPAERLPVVVLWPRFSLRAFQMGGPAFWHCDLVVDVFGRTRGDREDIAAAIAGGVTSFTIYDHSGSLVEWGTATVYENQYGEYWTLDPQVAGDEASVEGTLLNMMRCTTQLWCKPT
jgi:hypothetical protein